MECRRHVQLGPHQAHELMPERRGEDGVTIRHHGLRHPVKAHNVGEEGLSDGLGGVRMRQENKMAVLAKPVHHGQDD